MNVLITGGTGFIGSRLALRCVEMGYKVRALGQENTSAEEDNRRTIEGKGVEVTSGTVTDRAAVFQAMEGIDIVFHLAAAQHEMNIPDQKFRDVNVGGTRNVVEAGIRLGVKRLVHGSTIGVYGSGMNGTIDENSPLKPDNIYGVTKLEGEKVVLSFKEKLPVVIIRIPETYGPGDRRLLKLFRTINKYFFVIGKGENLHHLIYIDDLINGMLLAASSETAVGGIFLLYGKEAVTTNDMVTAIASELGKTIPKFHAPFWPFYAVAAMMEWTLRPMGIQPPLHRRRMDFFKKSFSFSFDESNRKLGFVPECDFRQGVRETLGWYIEKGYL
jgi:nucleoside-diphosphate-sugar epimerase